MLGEEEAREADKARLALGPSARKEWEEAGRCLLPTGVILRILDWAAMRGGYGAASFSMAGFMYASTLMRRIAPLGICPNGAFAI